MESETSRPRPSSRGSTSRAEQAGPAAGFTLVELLVGTLVGLAITGGALTLALSGRRIYQTDQNRTSVNQNLRAGMDLLGTDLRQAGERIPADVPAVEISSGSGGAPDTLLLRRNLIDAVLPVCAGITAGSNAAQVFVADRGPSPPTGCAPVPDQDADGWPDNMGAWKSYRQANSGRVLAFIYNPVGKYGEFFTYDSEDNAACSIHRASAGNWAHSYGVAEQCRVYILEERTYRLSGDLLQLVINGDTGNPMNLVCEVTDFQARAVMRDGTVLESLGAADAWSNLLSVEVTLRGQASFSGRTLVRSLSARYFPRNVLSR